ncbi:MAG: stalk domain-containing protein [Peptoniphilus sp.]|uniref:stalk domain-containing protein n=1 Tax=Peptoniphilus sp. TaxID=1971214 RepID=UPI00399A650D
MDKKTKFRQNMALGLTLAMSLGTIPYNVLANSTLQVSGEKVEQSVRSSGQQTDALSSATYYKKANWENKIKDKSRWKVEDNQNLVRVGGSDPLQMNDIDYDGMFIDANGRYVIRLVYKEKSQAVSGVWYRALINFGDLDKFIDFDLSYVLGKDGKTQYKFDPVSQFKGRGFDLGKAAGDRTNNRANLPINLVLKEGVDLDKLGSENYIVQMRVANGDYTRIYAYAPKGTSMDYSTYTKTTAVDLVDKLGTLFIKGGKQSDLNNATNQEFFMSEFIANPAQYPDKSNLGIIRTQYMGQTKTIVSETVSGQPFAFTQVFDSNLVNYLKADSKGNVAYVNVMTKDRKLSDYTKNVGIPKDKINYSKDGKLAYIVIGTKDFTKDSVKVVNVDKLDQHVMLSGFYITAIDYVVDKGQFENTFSNDKVRKLNYTTMSGWTNPNKDGWVVYEKEYDDTYVVPEGESYLIDTGDDPSGGQIMIQVGGDQAILRKAQGYYNGYVSGDGANDAIENYAKGVYKFTLREGATILKGKKLKVFMPYTSSHDKPVNFLEIHNGSKHNQGAAELTLQTDRNINMHIYTDKPRGASFKLRYTLKNETEEKSLTFTTPKIGTLWQYDDKDKVLTGWPNKSILGTAGNFYIDTTKLKTGADIFVDAYDEKGNKIDNLTSWLKYRPLDKSKDNVKLLTWVDNSDKKSVLSINKSLYTPYQLLFTNDYAEGSAYQDPRKLPADDAKFNTATTSFVGYTKYDGGKVRTLYEEGKTGKLFAKVQADENDYDDKGNIKGTDVRKKITIPKSNIFDAQFNGDNKEYTAYEYKVDLAKMLPYHSDDKKEKTLELKKDMKFVSTASDGSSLPSDLYETRVRARVLFDTTEGAWAEDSKEIKKVVKIVPDNTKFYGEDGYTANGFEGANVEANTGDKFPDAPQATGNKKFLGWVTAEGKKALNDKTTVSADEFNQVDKKDIFRADTPVTKHLVVYAIYSDETSVTFDANGGEFADKKEQTTVKATEGTVTAPANPTKEGYTFKGWADNKDATTPNVTDFTNITAPKTVYAVWEKTEKEPLTLKDPEKVEVKDLKSLTSDEIDKVKDAVIKANPTLTKADITVAEDGTVTVTKDGKTGTLTPDKTVKQKEVQNNFNPPKEPVPVDKIGELKPAEIAAIKKAVKDANQDRNFKDDEITVKPDGTVEINQGGKVGTIPADKTVVQKDTILDLTAPEKTEVKDPKNLTQPERDKVAAAVKEANKTKLSNDAIVTVDDKGNVTVKDGTKTGKLKAEDTVKPFTRDGKILNPPAQKVKVGDTNNLNETEKQAVRDAVKAANPDLGFTDDEVQVDSNGAVTVPMGDTKTGNIPADETVEQVKDTDNIIKLKAPEKTPVQNPEQLTAEEREAVKKAVKEANKNLPDTANIEVTEDGSVVVTDGEKNGTLSQKDTVVKDDTKLSLNKPRPVKVKDTQKLTEEEQKAVKDAVKAVNPGLTDDQITVDDKGNVTVSVKEGETTKTGKLGPYDTIEKDDTTPGAELKDPAKVAVKNPANLTDDEKAAIKKAVKEANPGLKDDQIAVDKEGNVTVTKPGEEAKTISKDKTVSTDVKAPAITEVANKSKLTDDEKTKVKEAVKTANPGLTDDQIEVKEDGTVVVKKDGKETTIPASDVVEQKATPGAELKDPAKVAVKNPANLTDDEKAAIKKAVKEANPGLKDDQIAVDKEGNVTVTKPGEEAKTISKDKTVSTDVKAPAVTEVANKSQLTKDEKTKVKEAVKTANSGLTDDQIEVKEDGTVVVTKDGKETTIPASDAVEEKATPGEGKPNVDDSNKKPVNPTNEVQGTGVVIKNPKGTTVIAKDEDGKNVPAMINPDGEIVVEPGYDVDGPIEVTIKDKNGKVIKILYIDILGHSKGVDDNFNGYPSDGGEYIIPGIRYRDHKTPTHPVTVTVPEKTDTEVKVHDTLWYVFRINDFQYEVVRNGVVTKRLMDVTPVLQNGRTMLPLRYVAEALQADVKWDAKTRTATFTKDGLTASIQIDSDEIVLSNGKTVKMDSKPLNINNRILVSVTNVANVFGLTNGNTKDKADQDIEWEQQDKSATIYIRR